MNVLSDTDDGITVDQVMASGCFPVNFDYTLLEVESYFSHDSVSNNDTPQRSENDGGNRIGIGISSPTLTDRDFSRQYRKEIRHFWDGGLLTNTPLSRASLTPQRLLV